ncbi:MAG: tetratricopeptide repeat protein [Nitrosomonadales bacterium]|nr:tetratricopeptide repeat protein [Nitrosomonadales bacterium]
MSVINQVLNQLERRGAHTAAEQPMVRAVLHTRRNFTMPLLLIALALIAGIAAWQWVSSYKPAVMAVSVAQKADSSPSSYELEKLIPQKQSDAAAAALGDLAGDPPDEPPAPASRLSFELSSLPLPSTLRHDSGQAASIGSGQVLNSSSNSNPAANPVPAGKLGTGKPVLPPNQIPATTAKIAAQAAADAVPMKQVSSSQRADAEFRLATVLTQQGQIADAIAGYEAALRLDASHEAARQALVALLLEEKRNADAEKVLLEGLNNKPEQTGFTMLLARLQVERGALDQAIATLEKSLPFAETQADYRAFLAALLQRQNRNEEAIAHYQIVLQHAPDNGVWLMGYGISLQALQRNAEAKVAFKRALDTQTLSPELQAFVQAKIKGL